ncbi:PH domain leucine-rich repeat-containing protein phosphatase 2 [Phytophthora pseudosyringae]|uniref:PH domain leucine-rich repeat-containing protein phosphatase 2 n=1 Tax=Phytophthora pseudosyringae TaxID=221518 RepID=A0A8T1WLL3_9STRA|nr:PH domain leucine-rich repeat-containing protein phosphatase 2 [Phytophthora pseudosyringae]
MRLWSLLYAVSLLVSSVASCSIAAGIYRHAELRKSAVRFIFFFFFFYSWLWSLFRGVFFLDAFLSGPLIDSKRDGDGDADYDDVLGLLDVAQSSDMTSPLLSCTTVLGDTALLGCSLWMLPMTAELSRLARKNMDRGSTREHEAARSYCKWVHAITVLFLVCEAGYTIYNTGFNNRSYRILISGNMLQGITLVYVIYVLISLKCAGRNYETIGGSIVLSPLYKRIKGIMIVYMAFSFQYQVISLILLFSRFDVHMPTMLIGVSTLLFHNSGTALSIVMGCSQECFFRSFRRYVPDEYVEAFYRSDPGLAMANAAAGYTPPLDNPVFVFTDIESSTQLWGFEDGAIMRRANEIHEDIIRGSLAQFRGYEITTAGDAFQLAFFTIKEAVEYCIQVQLKLLSAHWPKKLHNLTPSTARKKTKTKRLVFSGLRIRMGVHDAQKAEGALVKDIHPVTGKVTYTGLSEIIANEIGDVGAGGQICVTRRVAEWLSVHSASIGNEFQIDRVGGHPIPQLNMTVEVFQITPQGLDARKKTFHKHWAARLEDITVAV